MTTGKSAVPVPVLTGTDDPAFLLDGILDSFPEGSIFVFDRNLRYLAVGGQSLPAMGVLPERLVGRTVGECFSPETAEALEPSYRAALAGHRCFADRTWGDRTFQARLAPIVRNGRVVAGFGYSVDVTELRHVEVELRETSALHEAVLAASSDVVSVTDVETGTNIWTNDRVTDVLGYAPEDLVAMGTRLYETLLSPADLADFRQAVEDVRQVADGEIVEIRICCRHADGSDRWLQRRMTPFKRDSDGRVVEVLSITADVTDEVLLQQRLEHTALHDGLTGLPNRSLVSDRLKQALEASGSGEVAVLFCDLDGFKRINDGYGHAVGDHVLQVVAERMQETVRSGATVGRMGGDEFVVVLSNQRDATWPAVTLAERLEAVLAEPIAFGDLELSLTVSIGIAVAHAGDEAETVLRDSDTAMYRAKQHGKNRHVVFRGDWHDDAVSRARMEALLRRALAEDLLEVHYQPVVCSERGSVVSVEALVRVPTDSGEYVDAAELVTVAEQTGLIAELGERVLEQACTQVARWRTTSELAALKLAVNVSAPELARPALYDRVAEVLSRTGLPAEALVLELTETVLIDASPSTLSDLRRLRELGIGIAIDDFGTGYASLRYVAELPVTCVKVDGSFTRDMLTDPVSASLVRATIRLAEDLGMHCIVEGVETEAHRDSLPQGGHIGYQGYLFARPAPAGALF